MRRPLGYGSLLAAVALALLASAVRRGGFETLPLVDVAVEFWVLKALYAGAVVAAAYGLYLLVGGTIADRTANKRRRHDARNVLRLAFGVGATVALLGVVTEQWLGVLFSLGVVGFAVTFALQQPLFSLIGWFYIVVKRPYGVGDRVAIDDARGDVISVDFFVTTLWEIDGQLVSSNQPSGRTITVPNSVVLSSHVYNYTWEEFPHVWNEVTFQVAYETDLEFAATAMTEEADDLLGDEMAAGIERYRERLAETPVELEVRDRPSVNVAQGESWVELRLRYLVHPKRGQRVKNELNRRVLERFNDEPERVKFPVGRNR
ncbi:MAG: mechanosensitive ion channel family protein [Halobacteriaceae archaeon]